MATNQLDSTPRTAPATTATAPRYYPRPIPPHALTELRRVDDSGRTLQPFIATENGAPIDAVGSLLRCCLRGALEGERIALVSYAPLRRWAAENGARPGAYDEVGPVFEVRRDDS